MLGRQRHGAFRVVACCLVLALALRLEEQATQAQATRVRVLQHLVEKRACIVVAALRNCRLRLKKKDHGLAAMTETLVRLLGRRARLLDIASAERKHSLCQRSVSLVARSPAPLVDQHGRGTGNTL